MTDEMGSLFDDSSFREFMGMMAEKIVKDIADDVKNGELDTNHELVGSALLVCLQSHSFALLKALNFAWNADSDDDGFCAINQYLDRVQAMLVKAEERAKKGMK